jgi:peptidoglycan/LPS O-acetylase OafA/YrhL
MQRSLLIDGLRALASLLIVLHHLAFYGPMTDYLRPLAPPIFAWLGNDARMAVHVFLVIGGYLAARSLASIGRPGSARIGPLLWRRFLRLALPYHTILLIALASNELARSLMAHESISAPADLGQLLAHALLLQDLLGYEALSAGLWYVAIDLQLFLLLVALLWLGGAADRAVRRSHPRWAPGSAAVLVALLGAASLYYFNRDFAWDAWVFYFFGIYALGALAWWASRSTHALLWLGAIALGTAGALMTAFRTGLLLALVVALLLAVFSAQDHPERPHARRLQAGSGTAGRTLRWFGTISYSLFLVHFPVCLVVNAVFTRFLPPSVAWQAPGVVVALATSVAAAAAFHRFVELPLHRWVGRRVVVAPAIQT